MKIYIFIASSFLVLKNKKLYSQQHFEENEVFYTIVLDIKTNNQIFINCNKPKTYFNVKDFIKETSLKDIPVTVLSELNQNTKENLFKKEKWSDDYLLYFRKLPIINKLSYKKCLNINEINKIQDTLNRRNLILTISKPIFDEAKEHCIVNVVTSNYRGSFSAYSCFLKKVYGKWVIIERFGEIIS